jgi:hypothetical protein
VLSQFAHLFKIFDQKFGQGTMVWSLFSAIFPMQKNDK